ncbi:MAG: RES family NAD+ phosphorylase [Thermoanaerobaculia bacterium]
MITAWRITSAEYAETAFDGRGAKLYGGRWNSVGTSVIYTSSSAALAALELLVRIRKREKLRDYVIFACSFEAALIEAADRGSLPSNWRGHPGPAELRHLGDRWAGEARSAVLQVPSVIIETESNFLLNPAHPDFTKVAVADPVRFALDVRLLR